MFWNNKKLKELEEKQEKIIELLQRLTKTQKQSNDYFLKQIEGIALRLGQTNGFIMKKLRENSNDKKMLWRYVGFLRNKVE